LRRKGAAIVQQNGSWYGVTLTVRDKEITDLEILEEGSLAELRKVLKEDGYGAVVESGLPLL